MKLFIVHDGHRQTAVPLRIVRSRAAFEQPAPLAPIIEVPDPVVPDEFAAVKRFDAGISLEDAGAKSFTTVKTGDVISDYRDVTIRGYLSTFRGTTESDRQGDYVDEGAFKETIPRFKQNAVMLRDHTNLVEYLVGGFTTVREDAKGLFVEATLSNAPDVQSVRFKIAEGWLKTLSMGGLFHYKEDGRGIFKVDLWEGSLTPIPANPDARFSTRALTDDEKKSVKSGLIPRDLKFSVAKLQTTRN